MTEPLRIGGVPEHFNLPWRLAIAADAFSAAGLTVDYREVAAGTGEMTRALRDGELDVALVLTEGAVADVLAHEQTRLVKVWVRSPLIWGIHVAAGSDVQSIDAIAGRRYAISRYGSGSHLIAIVDAALRGWPTDALEFVVVDDLAGARKALAAGDADVFLWERFMTQPLVTAGEFRRVDERAVPWPAFVVSAARRALPARSRELAQALAIAERFARNLARRKSAVRQIAQAYGLDEETTASWFRTVRWASGFAAPSVALRRVVDALTDQGLVADGSGIERLWYRLDTPPSR